MKNKLKRAAKAAISFILVSSVLLGVSSADTDPLLGATEPASTAADIHAGEGFGVTAVTTEGTLTTREGGAEKGAKEGVSDFKLNLLITLPHIEDEYAADCNAYFAELRRYYTDEYAPMMLEEFRAANAEGGEENECSLTVDYTLTYADSDFYSVLVCAAKTEGSAYSEEYSAYVFSKREMARLTLYEVIPWENENPYSLAVHAAERGIKRVRGTEDDAFGYYDGIDEDWVATYLTDTSFYLGQDGKVVLFLNPAGVSPCTSGICLFPI
ncbi:MAG: hypothetical protein LBD16_05530 [Oscillospiraceae bacterium]|nr:hypothetical protein [Oscillospiraceae bacterium]